MAAARVGDLAPIPIPITVTTPSRPGSFLVINPAAVSWLKPVTLYGRSPVGGVIEFNPAGLTNGDRRHSVLALPGWNPVPIPVRLHVFEPGLQRFNDVPLAHPWRDSIALLASTEITLGCGINPPVFCPSQSITQAQMAAFLVRSLIGEDFAYRTAPYFGDTPPTHGLFKYVQKVYELGINLGCGERAFCPDTPVTRSHMAVYLVRALYGDDFSYPGLQRFADVPAGDPTFRYVQKLVELGVTQGCGLTEYCPHTQIPREQMAVFIARTFFRFQTLTQGL